MARETDFDLPRNDAREIDASHAPGGAKGGHIGGGRQEEAFNPLLITIDSLLAIIYENKGGV